MTLSEAPGALKRFRRTAWRFQQTFHIPSQNLQPFVAAIVAAREPLQGGCVTLDDIVFEPKHLIALLASHSLPPLLARESAITAATAREVAELLKAALGDWVDFMLVPTPKRFVIYADHDEYTTFYANTKSNLNGMIEALSAKGFQSVPDYARVF